MRLGVVQREQRPGVARGQHPRCDPPLHRRRKPEQSQGVADLWTTAADPAGQLLLGAGEVVEQLLVRGRLLQRVELRAVQVLQQRVPQQVVVGRVAHDRGDPLEPCLARGPPAPLPGDELVAVGTGRPHHDRLQQPDLADRVDELAERLLVEDGPWLTRVGRDLTQRQLRISDAGDRDQTAVVDIGHGARRRVDNGDPLGGHRHAPGGLASPRPGRSRLGAARDERA